MDERYYMEIDPFDKINEILESFKSYAPKVFSKTDKGFDWMEEDHSKCIAFKNPYGGEDLEIVVGDRGEFTLYYKGHAHYANYQYDYDLMIERVRDIFNNNICTGYLTDRNAKWYGSGYFKKSKIAEPVQKVFEFVFKEKEFYNHLTATGYKVEYIFWNPIYNKTIQNG